MAALDSEQVACCFLTLQRPLSVYQVETLSHIPSREFGCLWPFALYHGAGEHEASTRAMVGAQMWGRLTSPLVTGVMAWSEVKTKTPVGAGVTAQQSLVLSLHVSQPLEGTVGPGRLQEDLCGQRQLCQPLGS